MRFPNAATLVGSGRRSASTRGPGRAGSTWESLRRKFQNRRGTPHGGGASTTIRSEDSASLGTIANSCSRANSQRSTKVLATFAPAARSAPNNASASHSNARCVSRWRPGTSRAGHQASHKLCRPPALSWPVRVFRSRHYFSPPASSCSMNALFFAWAALISARRRSKSETACRRAMISRRSSSIWTASA